MCAKQQGCTSRKSRAMRALRRIFVAEFRDYFLTEEVSRTCLFVRSRPVTTPAPGQASLPRSTAESGADPHDTRSVSTSRERMARMVQICTAGMGANLHHVADWSTWVQICTVD